MVGTIIRVSCRHISISYRLKTPIVRLALIKFSGRIFYTKRQNMSEKIQRMLSLVEIKVELSDGQVTEKSMPDEKVADYVRNLLESREFLTITIKARDGE